MSKQLKSSVLSFPAALGQTSRSDLLVYSEDKDAVNLSEG